MIDTQEPPALSKRQHEVFLAMCDGLEAPEIAEEFEVSVATVRSHMHAIYRAYGVRSHVKVMSLALHRGLMPTIIQNRSELTRWDREKREDDARIARDEPLTW